MSLGMAPLVVSRDSTSTADVDELFTRYRRSGDPKDLESLVLQFLPLARHLARRYATAAERDDLEQVASLGLVKAIERFDPERGIAFTSYAVPTIVGELKRYFRDHGWSVRVPRSVQELAARVDGAVETMTAELGHTPTAEELAERLDSSVEHILEARGTGSAHRAESLDRPVGKEEASSLVELLGADDPGFERAEYAADLGQLLAVLPARERAVLQLRFEEDLVQREIGQRLGISQMHVSRLLRQGIARLQQEYPAS
jgi:RNA polymerase sigma-B factor